MTLFVKHQMMWEAYRIFFWRMKTIRDKRAHLQTQCPTSWIVKRSSSRLTVKLSSYMQAPWWRGPCAWALCLHWSSRSAPQSCHCLAGNTIWHRSSTCQRTFVCKFSMHDKHHCVLKFAQAGAWGRRDIRGGSKAGQAGRL